MFNMMKARASILLRPLFLLSLVLLICNDSYWKYEYSNLFTGKLSDVTGLFVLALFLVIFFSNRKAVVIFCAAFFIWWKSPLSQPVIDLFNFIHIPVYRTIDYTDFIALFILPAVFFVRAPKYKITHKTILPSAVGVLCL